MTYIHPSLTRKTGIKSTRKPMRRVSKRQAAINRKWSKVRAAAFEACGGRCVWTFEGKRCFRPAQHGHHLLARSQGGNADPVCLPLCEAHHLYLHEFPTEAALLGYVVRRSDSDPIAEAK